MTVAYKQRDTYTHMKCFSHWRQTATRPDCSQRKAVSVEVLQRYIDQLMGHVLQNNLALLDDLNLPIDRLRERITLLQHEIERKTGHIRQLIHNQAEAGNNTRDIYQGEITKSDQQLGKLNTQLAQLLLEEARYTARTQNLGSLRERLKHLSLDVFWNLPPHEINQFILAVLGDKRIFILDGEVIGVGQAPDHH